MSVFGFIVVERDQETGEPIKFWRVTSAEPAMAYRVEKLAEPKKVTKYGEVEELGLGLRHQDRCQERVVERQVPEGHRRALGDVRAQGSGLRRRGGSPRRLADAGAQPRGQPVEDIGDMADQVPRPQPEAVPVHIQPVRPQDSRGR